MQTIIEMEKYDTELLSPDKFLKLPPEEKREISSVKPLVRGFGYSLNKEDFVSLSVKWKNPKYKVAF